MSRFAMANEVQEDANWHSSYVELEAKQKHLESLISQTTEEIARTSHDQVVLKKEILSLNEMQDKLVHFQQVTAQLIKDNQQLLVKVEAQEMKESEYQTSLVKMQNFFEKMEKEMAKLEEKETLQKSRYQSINARVDNLAQQIDELQRKAVAKKAK